jgi:hypothetical protein
VEGVSRFGDVIANDKVNMGGRPGAGLLGQNGLWEQGFCAIAEGTLYPLLARLVQRGLVDVEKVRSEKGPPRKVFAQRSRTGIPALSR